MSPGNTISVEEAVAILDAHKMDFGVIQIPLEKCVGYVLRENIYADRDMPPFDRVAMDGIAIRHDSNTRLKFAYQINGLARAGSAQQFLENHLECIEVMTGAVLPLNTDTVIPYEWIEVKNGIATIDSERKIKKGQNIHYRSTDRKQNDLLIREGRLITAAETGILSTVGKHGVTVSNLPKVLIISTGDELISIHDNPLPHQIRMSNGYQIESALSAYHVHLEKIHINDHVETTLNALSESIQQFDIVIISGGISTGKFDLIPDALEKCGVEKHFYKVAQRPGKPFWFGTYQNKCAVFGIPGNPVSSFFCFIRFIIPWLEVCLKKEKANAPAAMLATDISFAPDLTYYPLVTLSQNDNAQTIASIIKGQGSGDLSSLADADAFIELPRGQDNFTAGSIYPLFKFR